MSFFNDIGDFFASGGFIGSALTSLFGGKNKSNNLVNEQENDTNNYRSQLKAEKSRVDQEAQIERNKINQGIARSLKARYKQRGGFLKELNEEVSRSLG